MWSLSVSTAHGLYLYLYCSCGLYLCLFCSSGLYLCLYCSCGLYLYCSSGLYLYCSSGLYLCLYCSYGLYCSCGLYLYLYLYCSTSVSTALLLNSVLISVSTTLPFLNRCLYWYLLITLFYLLTVVATPVTLSISTAVSTSSLFSL